MRILPDKSPLGAYRARNNTTGLLVISVAAALFASIVGCSHFNSNNASGAGSGMSGSMSGINFTTTVVVGDSLSAGFQNGSLLDSQQPNGWASLVAKQGSFNMVLPLIAPPGAPAVLDLISVGPPPIIQQAPGITTGRDNPSVQPTNIAVPGHTLNDLISKTPSLTPTSPEDIITTLVLGLPLGNDQSQMNQAIQMNPSVLFVWIGNEDALLADTFGTPTAMTPVATFTQEYRQLITQLQGRTRATLVVANIPDVTTVPYLTPAVAVIALAAAETGLSQTQISADLGIQPGDLINATGLAEAQAAVKAIQMGQMPVPLTDSGFLNATEIAAVQATVNQYNTAIAQQVAAAGGILVDIYTFNQNLVKNGITINNYNATTGFLGGLFSLDGLHPTNTGYALIANQFIDAMNAKIQTGIQDVSVSTVAAADPLFGPNIKPTGMTTMIPLNAARQVDRMVGGPK